MKKLERDVENFLKDYNKEKHVKNKVTRALVIPDKGDQALCIGLSEN